MSRRSETNIEQHVQRHLAKMQVYDEEVQEYVKNVLKQVKQDPNLADEVFRDLENILSCLGVQTGQIFDLWTTADI
ncbi:hypothetical protein CYMTET_29862 [Cymbomonas tetramitiformis]|uniref:Uncharacterized protein n=1 Tax=Cymbomonas tetramitiformis TaxID=36881 RepID=A0AAE0FKF8_9CHLO|nr:hypothetical protein CYMTET_29862 [Cymbomonas tetramitiformis]